MSTLLLHPDDLEALLHAQLGPALPPDWSGRRQRVEELASQTPGPALDGLLLALRDLELAGSALEQGLSGHRVGRLVAQDAISACFEARDAAGQPWALRVLRPGLRRDPVWRRRLERAPRVGHPALLGPGELVLVGDVLVQRTPLPGPALDGLGEPLDSALLARALVSGLAALRALHAAGQLLGPLGGAQLRLGLEGVALLWLDPVLPRAPTPPEDLAELGRALERLAPDEGDCLSALAVALAEHPPPTVDMAESLLRGALGARLAERRHALARRARGVADGARAAHLHRLARRLAAWQPPAGVWCLKAGPDASAWFVQVGADAVRGGQALGWPARMLPLVRGPEGLDTLAARALVRAWSTRAEGDEARRRQLQAELGGDDAQAQALVRWLGAQGRLRTLLRLMEHQGA